MIKKIIFVLACLFIFALNYNNESFAYTDEDQNIDISFVVPLDFYNNKLYSSNANNDIFWVIDFDTFNSSDWRVYNYTTGSFMQIIDTDSIGIDTFYNFLDSGNRYIIFNIRKYQEAYMAPIPNIWNISIVDTTAGVIPYNLNGPYMSSFNNVSYKNKNYIETLLNSLNTIQLTLQLNNEIYFENGFDSGSTFGYDMGYQEGYDIGVIDGTTAGQLQIWQNGYDKGEADGIKLGEASGYDSGFVDGVLQTYEGGFEGYPYSQLSMLTDNTSYPYYLGIYASDSTIAEDAFLQGRLYERNNPVMFSWIRGLFVAMGAFLGIEILPSITIGLIVSIPLLFSLVMYFIKLFRGS